MKITHRMGWLSALIIVLLLSSLACNLPGRNSAEPTTLPTIPVTTQAVESLQDTIDSAKEAFNNNQTAEITVSETQLTSLAALELESNSEIPLTDPQIYLRDGQVSIFASLTQNQIAVPVEIVLEAKYRWTGQSGVSDHKRPARSVTYPREPSQPPHRPA